jgi:hypothetical protein
MSYSINTDHQNRIIHYRHSGFIGKDEIGMAWQEFLQMKEFTELKYNLLSDYTDAKFNMNIKDIDEITGFLARLKPILDGKKQALIMTEPMTTALSLLFEGDVNEQVGFIVKVFSEKEAGLNWIKT